MTEDELHQIIKASVSGEITYRDTYVFLAAVEWAATQCSDDAEQIGRYLADHLRREVAQLG